MLEVLPTVPATKTPHFEESKLGAPLQGFSGFEYFRVRGLGVGLKIVSMFLQYDLRLRVDSRVLGASETRCVSLSMHFHILNVTKFWRCIADLCRRRATS